MHMQWPNSCFHMFFLPSIPFTIITIYGPFHPYVCCFPYAFPHAPS
jgi:hypothetical protein